MNINLYDKIKAETEVLQANPHRLIQLLFERSLQQIQMARHHMERKNLEKKSEAITKAMDIIFHLRGSLNFNEPEAKKISEKLSVVYMQIEKELLNANLKNDPLFLDKAKLLLEPIKESWDKIGEENGK